MEKDNKDRMTVYSACFGEGKYRVEAIAVPCGRDLAVTVVGGTAPHIGASVLAVPRPSLSDPSRISSSASVICVTGHKDDDPARKIASSLASTLDCIVTVTAGIHIDDASTEDLKTLEHNISNLLDQLKKRLKIHFRA
jgi:gallate decarboxylase subunit D